jgi:peptidoglycan/xylan/chitin deacetylase (PgdA/CDA1 family)
VADVRSAALVSVRIGSVGNRPRALWAEGLRVHLPAALLDRTGWHRGLRPDGVLEIPEAPGLITAADVTSLREHRAFTDRRPLSARLPVSYRIVPGRARAILASAIGRWNRHRVDRWAAFPGWPIDLSTDVLDDLRDGTALPDPPAPLAPVVLTHDIDSPEGLTNLVDRFLPLEEAAGARSTSYIVPCAWRLDHGLVGEVIARGHEVGVHGCDHSNTTPFAAAETRARRLDAARSFAERYGAAGYRAPSLLRTRALLRDVGRRYRYDSSIPTAGGLFPIANNGCASARPFRVEGAVELPVTLPRDGTLRFLGCEPDDMLATWIECAELLARSRGIVVLLTHCERRFSGHPGALHAYRLLLDWVRERSDRFAFSTPGRVLEAAALQAHAGTL